MVTGRYQNRISRCQVVAAEPGPFLGRPTPPPITPIRPPRAASQHKVLNKLFDAGRDGFAGCIRTETYTAIAQVSRATAYRELTDMVALGGGLG